VAVFAQGPIGLCATLGARLMGASEIYTIDADRSRLAVSATFGATQPIVASADPVHRIREWTDGRGCAP